MGLSGLKKGDRKIKASDGAVADKDRVCTVDDFIYAAPLQARDDELTADVNKLIDDLKLMAIGFHTSRSDVVKAAVAYLARQDSDIVVAELRAIAKPNK